mgnify:CR=1 FL=1
MIARTLRNIGWKIDRPMVSSRSAVGHENRARVRRPGAVVGVVVAIAEEQAVVVVGGVLADVVDERRARRSLASSQSSSSPSECRCSKTRSDRLPKTSGSRSCFTRKAADRDAVDLLDAGLELVAPA